MEPISVFTIGYEKRKIEDFVERLQQFGVNVLIDVREVPASRKPGFSKNKLKEYLGRFNIMYVHTKELGSPKELRQKLYQDNDYDYFFKEYRKHLKTQMSVVRDLYLNTIVHGVSCFMCMEKEPSDCHRKIVAEKIKEVDGNGLIIKHL
ncbi:MAG: DUF488 domain-containing protein [Thermodesulfobacteriota bacterium]